MLRQFSIACLLALLLPALATAVVDPDPDGIGVYFDVQADTVCTTAGLGDVVDIYYVITRPSHPDILTVRAERRAEIAPGWESFVVRTVEDFAPTCGGCIDLSLYCTEWQLSDLSTFCATPPPVVEGAAVFRRLRLLFLADGLRVDFYLAALDPEFSPLRYVTADGLEIPLTPSSGSEGAPVAAINGECDVVTVRAVAFGAVKALYR